MARPGATSSFAWQRRRAPGGLVLATRAPWEARVLLNGRAELAKTPAASDLAVVAALLRGEETAFLTLVKRHHRAMIRLARLHLRSEALAEEVAQDCWVVVLRRLEQWTGRGSLRSWILGIVINQARSRASRESRTIPLSMLESDEIGR